MTPDPKTPPTPTAEAETTSPQRPTKPRAAPVIQSKLPPAAPPTGRHPRPRLRIASRTTAGARLWDALVALVLASLVTYYVDFKIRKPGYVPVKIEAPALPEGVEGVELAFKRADLEQVLFAIDAPKEVLSRLSSREMRYDFGLTADDIETAKREKKQGEKAEIRHRVDLGNVRGLPAHVDLRLEQDHPAPQTIDIVVTPYCEASLAQFELVGSFAVGDLLEVVEQRPPETAVNVKVLGLDSSSLAARGTLLVDVSKHRPFVSEVERDIPLSRLECRLRIGSGTLYDVEILDPTAAVHVVVEFKREQFELPVPVKVIVPPGMRVDDRPPTVQVMLSLPPGATADLTDQLREAASEDSSSPLRVVVVVPARRAAGETLLKITNDAGHPTAVPAEVNGLSRFEGVKFERFVTEGSIVVVPE